MISHDELRELLPWHVTGRLSQQESTALEDHLASCDECRREIVTLRELRLEVGRHGAGFFEPHPEPEALVDAVRGDHPQRDEILRHVEMCETCAVEASLLRRNLASESTTAQSPSDRAPSAARWIPWAMAAAMALVAVLATIRGPSPSRETGPLRTFVIDQIERGIDEPVVALSGETSDFQLILPLDVGLRVASVDVEITHESGNVSFHGEIKPAEGYVFIYCLRDDFPVGAYRARMTYSSGGTSPIREYRFRLEGPGVEELDP